MLRLRNISCPQDISQFPLGISRREAAYTSSGMLSLMNVFIAYLSVMQAM
jgi:hypothetical protein